MPLMIIGGSSGSIYEILVNSIGDPLVSALNATDKITDEQALAAQITLALSGNVKHLTPANIKKMTTVLTEKFRYISKVRNINARQIAEELKGKIAKIVNKNSIQRELWNGVTNIYKATADEIAEAATKIKNHRVTNNLKGKNIGYLEGSVGSKAVENKMWLSISRIDAEKEIHIFNAIEVEGAGGSSWLRITDSEYRMLNKLAEDLGAVKGGKYPNIEGELKIVSELPYCASCTGIIQQFNEMFPKIKLILIDGAK